MSVKLKRSLTGIDGHGHWTHGGNRVLKRCLRASGNVHKGGQSGSDATSVELTLRMRGGGVGIGVSGVYAAQLDQTLFSKKEKDGQ